MIPAAFDYKAPATLEEAIAVLRDRPGDAKVLAGGHSLLPMMKLRLAQPALLVDLRRLHDQLSYVRRDGDRLRIGALTTHADVAASPLVREQCPLLAETAAVIADIQVRNRGTIGGSIAHADPVADYPAALQALGAEVRVHGPGGERTIPIDGFLLDAFMTALGPDEIVTEVSVPTVKRGEGWSYYKFANKASHFAVVGVAATAQLDHDRLAGVTVGITGAGPRAVRAGGVEAALRGQPATPQAIEAAAAHAAEGIECLSDLHGSAEYRAHLCRVLTKRAINTAVTRSRNGRT